MEDDTQDKRLDILLRHISNVREDCEVLGLKLIKQGEETLGRQLIANGLIHDNSKFSGIEWEYLHTDVKEINPEAFKLALQQHQTTNPHHPEYWGDINSIPRLYVAEMLCDWHARSSDFGTDLWDWVKETAVPKYKLSTSGKVYKQLKEFMGMLLERSFT
jgi:hypothetical protein